MIIVDESDPVDEVQQTFPYRDVVTRRDVSIREAYEVLEEIGRGKFGRVYRCKDKETGLILAAKVVTTLRKEERRNVEREIEIMKKLQHPRVIQLFDAIEDIRDAEMCLILEMVGGGELFDRVIQDEFILTERACAVFVRQICEGIEYIHSKSILHLDMKPENVMCLSKSGNRIKIIDFGLARFYDPSRKLQVLFGTPEFVAPEVVNFDEIDYKTDMWSIGVITYVLLSGLSPFMGETDVETMANVTIAKYDFDDECFEDISEEAEDFISKLLTKNKRGRMSARECLKHQWLLPKPRPKSPSPSPIRDSSPCSTDLSCVDIDTEETELKSDSPDELEFSKRSSEDTFIESDSDNSDTVQVAKNKSNNPSRTLHLLSSVQMLEKRPSLDLTKDHLREFVCRYTDNPYIFDSPRGIITHLCPSDSDKEEHNENSSSCLNVTLLNKGSSNSTSNSNMNSSSSSSNRSLSPLSSHGNNIDCGINIVSQIRRYSYQLHEELEMMKKQCNTLRKCSWSEVNAQ